MVDRTVSGGNLTGVNLIPREAFTVDWIGFIFDEHQDCFVVGPNHVLDDWTGLLFVVRVGDLVEESVDKSIITGCKDNFLDDVFCRVKISIEVGGLLNKKVNIKKRVQLLKELF